MSGQITLEDKVRDLPLSGRLKNGLHLAAQSMGIDYRTAAVSDFMRIPDDEFMRMRLIGKKTLTEWKEATAHLREGYVPDPELRDKVEAYRSLRDAAMTLNKISAAHKSLGVWYAQLANIVLPLHER